jgi:hypothetical protein
MNAHSAIKAALATAEMIGLAYLEDLSDNEMMVRPVEGCNHIKWQLGHLIVSGALPDLPLGFAQRYASDKSNDDAAISFDTKDELLQLYRQQRAATLRTLDGLTEQQLDAETHESIRSYAPTVGTAFVMQDSHWMMHAGQWAVVRRKLGRKPIF